MAHIPFYWLLLCLGCAYALAAGGAPERIVAILFLAASALTALANGLTTPFVGFQPASFLVDLVLLIALLALAERSTRYWPLWLAALQFWQTASHFVIWLPAMFRLIYSIALAFWAYPMIVILAVGTLRHRVRVRQRGSDPAWAAR